MSERTQVRVEIYDPPMCCPGGLCGPDIDDELLDVSEAVLRISKEFRARVLIQRYVLSQQPMEFAQNQAIRDLLQAEGVEVLPVTCLDGEVWMQRRYPAFEELQEAIGSRLGVCTANPKERQR